MAKKEQIHSICHHHYYIASTNIFTYYLPFIFFHFFNVYLFLTERETQRERQSMSVGGAERGGDTESKAGSRL